MEEPIIAPVENTPEQPVVETEVVVSSVDVVLEQPVIEQSVVETVPSVEDI